MSLTPPSPLPPLLEKYIFFALPSMNGPLPSELKFRENTACVHKYESLHHRTTTDGRSQLTLPGPYTNISPEELILLGCRL